MTNMKQENIYPQFKPNQKVRSIFGERLTVLYQRGCQVFVVEKPNTHYHPTKVFPDDQVKDTSS